MADKDLEIRELKTKDLFTVAHMLLKVTGSAKEGISNLITSSQLEETAEEAEGEGRENNLEMGLNIAYYVLQACLEHAEKDLMEWFGDLVGMNADEFAETSIDTSMVIIDELANREDLQNFFSKAFSLYRKMNRSANQLGKK